jgi:serine protease Do
MKNVSRSLIVGRIAAIMLLLTALVATPVFAKDDNNTSFIYQSSKEFVNVVKNAKPAVVRIRVEKTEKQRGPGPLPDEMMNNPFFEHFFGPQFRQQQPQREYKQQGLGSGFIISKDGYILTNNHVVEGADVIKVTLSDEREFDAKLIGNDPQSDVALIKITDHDNLPVLPLGNSDELEVGEWVIAIGNPFGLSQTVSVGVVSATGRSSIGINDYENFIQTDAAINPGNSGGPLINGRGEVVGINTALFSRTGGYMGIGFAIPINMAKAIQDQLRTFGKVTRGWLGVVIQNITKDLADSFNLKEVHGILVSEVQHDSPASAAGLQQGDVITHLNDVELKDVSDLRNKVAMIHPDTKVMLTILREGREKKVQVTIGQQPANFSSQAMSGNQNSMLEKYGLTLQELTPEMADKFQYKVNSGLIISDVEEGSPAQMAGLKPGQLIEEVNRERVRNLDDLQKVMKTAKDSDKILLRVRAGDYARYIVLSVQ